MLVRDVMSRKLVTIDRTETCVAAVRRMHAARIRHLPVVDAAGRLLGIVTDRDLRHHLFSPAVFPALGMTSIDTLLAAAQVADLMATDVVTVRPEQSLGEAAQVMLMKKVGSLPVVEAGRVVGILTETDMLRMIVRTDAGAECAEVIVSFP
jgi:CBS domain-containing protein